jgi:hypothetical protein
MMITPSPLRRSCMLDPGTHPEINKAQANTKKRAVFSHYEPPLGL